MISAVQPDLDFLVPRHVRSFEPYISSKTDDELKKLYRCDHLYRLNNNENPLGPPEAARAIIAEFDPKRASLYPSGDSYHLRHALADRFRLDPAQFIVGNGATEVITFDQGVLSGGRQHHHGGQNICRLRMGCHLLGN